MFRHDTHRWLLAILLAAALPAISQTPPRNPAQIPAVASTPAQTSGSTSLLPIKPVAAPGGDRSAQASAQAVQQIRVTPEDLGDSLLARQRYQGAIAAYAKVDHPSARLWNKMGIAYQMMFNSKEATRCYRESLKLDPRNTQVLNNLGTVYDSMKDYKHAERMYRKALKIDPRSAPILKNLGTNLLVRHKYDRGWQAYQKALAIDPNIFEDRNGPKIENPTAIAERGAMNYYMARGCLRAGQTGCALEYLRRALDEGFTTPKKLAADADFYILHDNPAFKQLLADEQQQKRTGTSN